MVAKRNELKTWSRLSPVGQAVVVLTLTHRLDRFVPGKTIHGGYLHRWRHRVLRGKHDTHEASELDLPTTIRLGNYTITDLPPAKDVRIAIEALSQRMGAVGAAAAWRSIGVPPRSGYHFTASSGYISPITWPIWRTLRDAALKGDFG